MLHRGIDLAASSLMEKNPALATCNHGLRRIFTIFAPHN